MSMEKTHNLIGVRQRPSLFDWQELSGVFGELPGAFSCQGGKY